MNHALVVSLPINVIDYDEAVGAIVSWATERQSRTVCAANVHVVMEAKNDTVFRQAVESADMVTPDGVPLVWALKLLGWKKATRVYGPDLMLKSLESAEKQGIPIGLYGASPETLDRLVLEIRRRFPNLVIAHLESPPFRRLTTTENAAVVERINASGTRVLFVGLGCPKQELWMASQRGNIHAVLLGVGAAFDFIAGTKRQAPAWIQRSGLEWLFRLCTEPRRLWRRYATHNPRFVLSLIRQLGSRRSA